MVKKHQKVPKFNKKNITYIDNSSITPAVRNASTHYYNTFSNHDRYVMERHNSSVILCNTGPLIIKMQWHILPCFLLPLNTRSPKHEV